MAGEDLDENIPREENDMAESLNGCGEATEQSPTVEKDEDEDKGNIFVFNATAMPLLFFRNLY